MIFFRICLVFCSVALIFAVFGDLLLIWLVHAFGGVGVFADSDSALNRAFAFVMATAWILSLLVGWVVARRLNLVPHL